MKTRRRHSRVAVYAALKGGYRYSSSRLQDVQIAIVDYLQPGSHSTLQVAIADYR